MRDPYYREFGARIRSARGTRSQSELAGASGLTRSAIANIESGRVRVTLDVLDTLAIALGTEPAKLLPPSRARLGLTDAGRLQPQDRLAIEQILARVRTSETTDDAQG